MGIGNNLKAYDRTNSCSFANLCKMAESAKTSIRKKIEVEGPEIPGSWWILIPDHNKDWRQIAADLKHHGWHVAITPRETYDLNYLKEQDAFYDNPEPIFNMAIVGFGAENLGRYGYLSLPYIPVSMVGHAENGQPKIMSQWAQKLTRMGLDYYHGIEVS